MRRDSESVRSSGQTGSDRRRVKTARTGQRKLVAVGEVAQMAGLLDFSQARPFAPAPSTANSALEGAQLVQPRHPVFGVPGAEDLPVLELMDVDGLDTQAAAPRSSAYP